MANLLLFVNNATSTLLGAVGPTDVVMSLPNGQGALFPNPSAGHSFMLTIEDTSGNVEIVECTGRTTDVLTVVRGREGTAARAFTASTTIEARVTAGMLAYLDWQTPKNTANSPAVLDINAKLPIAAFDTPLQVYGDNRWNAKLGYTPVQQGGGTGQGANKVYIGWDGTNVLVQIDTTVFQAVVRTGGGTAMQLTNARFKAVSSTNEDDIFWGPLGWYTYANATTALGLFHPTKGQGFTFTDSTRAFNVAGPITQNNVQVSLVGHTHVIADSAGLQSTLNGLYSVNGGNLFGDIAMNGHSITGATTVSAANIIDTSDARIKRDVVDMTVADATALVRGTVGKRFFNTSSNRLDFGVIADLQERITPELVTYDAAGMRGVAYQRMIAPLAVVMQSVLTRLDMLEART